MVDALTSVGLTAATILSGAASVMAWRRLQAPRSMQSDDGRVVDKTVRDAMVLSSLVSAVLTICLGLIARRWGVLDHWRPIAAQVDGLLLMSAVVSGGVLYVLARGIARGMPAFVLPLLTVMLLWGVCASWWTYRMFDQRIEPVWQAVHLVGVFLGTACAIVASAAAGMYLWAQRQLKRKVTSDAPMSLEALERWLVRASAIGFALLTLGLISGSVLLFDKPDALGVVWYASTKVWLAVGAWVLYAGAMNARHATAFRGSYAAWVAILGLLLLIGVYGIVTAAPLPVATGGLP